MRVLPFISCLKCLSVAAAVTFTSSTTSGNTSKQASGFSAPLFVVNQVHEIRRSFYTLSLRTVGSTIAMGDADDFSLAKIPVLLVGSDRRQLTGSDKLLAGINYASMGCEGSARITNGGSSIASPETGRASLLGMLILAIASLLLRKR